MLVTQLESCEISREVYIEGGANEGSWTCQNACDAKGMPSTMYGVLCLTTFPCFQNSEFQVQQAPSCAQSIKARPVMIAYKTAELFAVFKGPTQRGRTIGEKNFCKNPFQVEMDL